MTPTTPTLTTIETTAQAILDSFSAFETTQKAIAHADGPLPVPFTRGTFYETVLAHRNALLAFIISAADEDIHALLACDAFFDAGEKLRGCLVEAPPPEEDPARACFEKGWQAHGALRSFLVLTLCVQPFELPLHASTAGLSEILLLRYTGFLLRQPHLMRIGDSALYLAFYHKLTNWLETRLDASPTESWLQLLRAKLTFGACYYVDGNTFPLWQARGRILARLNARDPSFQTLPALSQNFRKTRKRIGILSRTLKPFTDTRALYGLFEKLKTDRYEVFWYELDTMESFPQDPAFEAKLEELITTRRRLTGTAAQMAHTIRSDDLDVFVLGTAYGTGAKELDRLLACRLGRIGISLAALVAGTSGLNSFDYYFVSEEQAVTRGSEASETLLPLKGPLLRYERAPLVPPRKEISRTALGLPEKDILLASGAAANKLIPETLHCWLRILAQLPHSSLLLFPFNPAWGGYFIAQTLFARLRLALKDYPNIDPARIVIAREVSPDDFERLIGLCDIYLGSFPRDGGTAAAQALRYAKPLVARREGAFHSLNDALMLRALDQEAWIGQDSQEITQLAIRLGENADLRRQVSAAIQTRLSQTALFDPAEQSTQMLESLDRLFEREVD